MEDTGTTRDRPRTGRPRVTTPNQDRVIRLTHLRDRFQSATQTEGTIQGRHNPRLSAKTVLRRLREHNIRPRRAFVGPVLDNRRQRLRLQWARNHAGRGWPHRKWNNVMFSDESRFLLFQNDARQRVYRRPGERYHLPCVQQIDRFGGGSTMVWGAIRFGWKSRLLVIDRTMTAQRYMDTVLQMKSCLTFSIIRMTYSCMTMPAPRRGLLSGYALRQKHHRITMACLFC